MDRGAQLFIVDWAMKEENLLPFTTKLNTVSRNIVGDILLLTLPSTNPPHGHSALYQAPAGLCVQVNALLLPIQGGLPMSNPTKLIVGACYLKILGDITFSLPNNCWS